MLDCGLMETEKYIEFTVMLPEACKRAFEQNEDAFKSAFNTMASLFMEEHEGYCGAATFFEWSAQGECGLVKMGSNQTLKDITQEYMDGVVQGVLLALYDRYGKLLN